MELFLAGLAGGALPGEEAGAGCERYARGVDKTGLRLGADIT
jgi:hypothetical protein